MDIEKIIQQMTLAEKADFCSGSDFWHTQPVERLGVPAVMMSDGPSGLRKQDEQGDHHAQRLCLFDHRFKGGKIDLVQGALVHPRRRCCGTSRRPMR